MPVAVRRSPPSLHGPRGCFSSLKRGAGMEDHCACRSEANAAVVARAAERLAAPAWGAFYGRFDADLGMQSGLIANLALALMAALVGAIIALRLRQSAVVGYIAAGVVIGPFTPGFVADPHAVEELADLGLVFLLFTIGAELSLRDL